MEKLVTWRYRKKTLTKWQIAQCPFKITLLKRFFMKFQPFDAHNPPRYRYSLLLYFFIMTGDALDEYLRGVGTPGTGVTVDGGNTQPPDVSTTGNLTSLEAINEE